jgi:hypothetical protein
MFVEGMAGEVEIEVHEFRPWYQTYICRCVFSSLCCNFTPSTCYHIYAIRAQSVVKALWSLNIFNDTAQNSQLVVWSKAGDYLLVQFFAYKNANTELPEVKEWDSPDNKSDGLRTYTTHFHSQILYLET